MCFWAYFLISLIARGARRLKPLVRIKPKEQSQSQAPKLHVTCTSRHPMTDLHSMNAFVQVDRHLAGDDRLLGGLRLARHLYDNKQNGI